MKIDKKFCAALLIAATASPVATKAATGNVPFAGLITSTCVLTVGTPGVLGPSADFTSLSSANSGGLAGTVQALATGATFRVSAVAPTSFTLAPTGGDTAVSFATQYSGTGASSIGSTPGTSQTLLNAGLTSLNINLAATKSSGVFPAGAYAAEVIVRCE